MENERSRERSQPPPEGRGVYPDQAQRKRAAWNEQSATARAVDGVVVCETARGRWTLTPPVSARTCGARVEVGEKVVEFETPGRARAWVRGLGEAIWESMSDGDVAGVYPIRELGGDVREVSS